MNPSLQSSTTMRTEVSSFIAVTRELCVLLTSPGNSNERNENETRARS